MKTKSLLNSSKLILLILASFLLSCKGQKDKQAQSNITYSEELAKEISFVTSGDIHFDDAIQVIFNDAVVEENEVNTSPKDVFSFSPNLKAVVGHVGAARISYFSNASLNSLKIILLTFNAFLYNWS